MNKTTAEQTIHVCLSHIVTKCIKIFCYNIEENIDISLGPHSSNYKKNGYDHYKRIISCSSKEKLNKSIY